MKLLSRIFSVILCLIVCVSLSACQTRKSGSMVNDSYHEGIDQGELNSFLALWDSSYNGNVRSCGNYWNTDDFSLVITTKRGSKVDANIVGSESDPYIEVDLSLHEGTIEQYWKNNKMLFYIYSFGNEGWSKVWGSDDYYWYFYVQGDDIVGNKEYAETRIYEGTDLLAVIIVIDGCTYTASYSVNI